MEFRDAGPDYENMLRRAGWRIYIERETVLHGMQTARRLILRAIKFNDKVKVSASEEFEHGAWQELFEQALHFDSSLIMEDDSKDIARHD